MHAFLYPDLPDLPENPDVLRILPEKSIGIEEVRTIQHFLSRKPVQSDHNTVVISAAHLLTLPAQHAFLKTLEEPPGNSLIYLITKYPDSLLPTILSRVQIANLPNLPNLPNDTKLVEKLLESKVGDRLALLDSQNFTRESFLAFLDQFEYYLHSVILKHSEGSKPDSSLTLRMTDLIFESRKYLKSNCNLKLIAGHLALNL